MNPLEETHVSQPKVQMRQHPQHVTFRRKLDEDRHHLSVGPGARLG